MKFKKAIVVLLAALFASSCFACTPSETETVTVYMPDGAPAVALSKLMHDGYADTKFVVAPSGDVVRARVATGDADMAILPVNAAAALYNGGADIRMLSVNTHGNLYIISKTADGEPIELDDLIGSRIAVIGQFDVPGLTFRMLLDKAEIAYETSANAVAGKVAVTYVDKGDAAIGALGQGKVDYALLAEPAVSNAVKKLNGEIECDVQEQWNKLFGGTFPQACLIARNGLDDRYIAEFTAALAASDGWAEQHPTEAVAAVRGHAEVGTESTVPDLTEAMIRGCNIKTVLAVNAKSACAAYFSALGSQKKPDGTPVLAKAPDDGFYYEHTDGID